MPVFKFKDSLHPILKDTDEENAAQKEVICFKRIKNPHSYKSEFECSMKLSVFLMN